MADEWWKSRRRLRVDDTSKALLGTDPRSKVGADTLAAQQFEIGVFVRACYDKGFDPISLVQNLLVGACFIADNHGISRSQMAKLIEMVELKTERQLIYKPGE